MRARVVSPVVQCSVGHIRFAVCAERSRDNNLRLRQFRARSCVRGRSFVVVRGRARSVVRGRAVVPFCSLRGQHCRDTNERTTSNNPRGVGWVKFFYPIKVRVSMGTCVPNLGAIRRPVRKFCVSNL